MRAGGYTIQQTLTPEAASVLKHSLSLARRRGHAQVTPLHVAATLLTSRPNLLTRACLKSHPQSQPPNSLSLHHHHHHPLQCRALELCFNVALNRLPTSPAGPGHGPLMIHGQATLSNALIAALKRAQAHQRRGCIEQQQQQAAVQPLLTVKVELEQLVISILDDPSVSRVMREAGFSSTAVKNNIEEDSSSSSSSSAASSVFHRYGGGGSGGVFSSPSSPSNHANPSSGSLWQTHHHLLSYNGCYTPPEQTVHPLLYTPPPTSLAQKRSSALSWSSCVKEEDVKLVFEVMLRKKMNRGRRSNVVIVGDCLWQTEGLVMEVMSKVERGEVPEEMRSARFIKFQFGSSPALVSSTFRYMKREDVETSVSQLKKKIHDHFLASGGGGSIVYTGDLKWTLEKTNSTQRESDQYSPADHLIMEIERLLSCALDDNNNNDGGRGSGAMVWLMATADLQTYMRCQAKQPPPPSSSSSSPNSLEAQWGLQPVAVPSGGLGLTLHASNTTSSINDTKSLLGSPSQLLEVKPFTTKLEEQDDLLTCCVECNSNYEKEAELFMSSASQHNHLPSWLRAQVTDTHHKEDLIELRKKWNRLCRGLHPDRVRRYNSSTVCSNQSSMGKAYNSPLSHPWWPTQGSIFPDANSISFSGSPLLKVHNYDNQSFNMVPRFRRQQSCTIEFGSVGGWTENKHDRLEPNLDSLKNTEGKELKITLTLGNSLFTDPGKSAEQNIERMLLRGNMRRLLQDNVPWQSESIPGIVEALFDAKSTTKDTWLLVRGNDTVGKRRLACSISESIFGSADFFFHVNIGERGGKGASSDDILARMSRKDEKLVILLENVDLADKQIIKFLADRLETGRSMDSNQGEQNQGQVVFILTTGDSTAYDSRKSQEQVVQMTMNLSEILPAAKFDCKRKQDWGLADKVKYPRTDGKDHRYTGGIENDQEVISRQSSLNVLDLNIKADEDSEIEGKPEDLSPNSSDLTRESSGDILSDPQAFLESIENQFTFNRSLTRDREMTEFFCSKIKKSFDEVYGGGNKVRFSVDHGVLEGIVAGGGFFLNSLFEKWLKDIFQIALQIVNIKGGRDGISVRLCLGGKEEGNLEEDGYMSTCLPKKIQVSYGD